VDGREEVEFDEGWPAETKRSTMPTSYERDDHRRLITITLTDPFRVEELFDRVDQQWAEQVWLYAVLYDARTIAVPAPPSELQRLTQHVQVVGNGQRRGPVGVVIPRRADMLRGGIQLSTASAPFNDLEILLNDAQVDVWLARHALRR
jgi:hypothetical protein